MVVLACLHSVRVPFARSRSARIINHSDSVLHLFPLLDQGKQARQQGGRPTDEAFEKPLSCLAYLTFKKITNFQLQIRTFRSTETAG